YQWVAPQNGVPQGSFEPVILLITPKQDQYMVAGMDYQINPQTRVVSELSFSNRDPNSFSSIGNAQNRGLAAYNSIERRDTLGTNKWVLDSRASYELRTASYQPPEQYRPVEFARDWNVVGAEQAMEHFAIGGVKLSNREKGLRAAAQVTSFQR